MNVSKKQLIVTNTTRSIGSPTPWPTKRGQFLILLIGSSSPFLRTFRASRVDGTGGAWCPLRGSEQRFPTRVVADIMPRPRGAFLERRHGQLFVQQPVPNAAHDVSLDQPIRLVLQQNAWRAPPRPAARTGCAPSRRFPSTASAASFQTLA